MYTYDPAKVVVNVAGINLEDYADGTFVTIERSSDTFTKVTGADGKTTRVKQNDKSGTITVTLSQSSPSNSFLSSIMIMDETTGDGIVPVTVKDILSTSLMSTGYAWVKKPPASPYAKEHTNREWVFDCAVLEMFIGSSISFMG